MRNWPGVGPRLGWKFGSSVRNDDGSRCSTPTKVSATSALPITYTADLIRGGLTGHYDVSRLLAFAVVGGYCALGLVIAGWAARRRM